MRTKQEGTVPTSKIGARDLLLLLIGLGDSPHDGLGGITRIQKLIYLLETEENIKPEGEGFKFEPYKAGPYSPRIYDDLEFLENLDYIRRAGTHGDSDEVSANVEAEASDPEKAEVDLTFENLMGPEDVMSSGSDEIGPTADSYEGARFTLTPKGQQRMEQLLGNKDYTPFVDGIRKAKSRFSKYSLNDLLYYVYTRHPQMTTESEIKEKVLRRRPS
jgi:hypothetical protein